MKKIIVLDGHTLNPGDLTWQGLEALGRTTVYERIPYINEEIVTAIGDADAVFTNKTPLRAEVLENSPNLKYIGVLATGFNIVDIVAARKIGITVANVPSYSTLAVAQMTLALLLEMCHHIGAHDRAVHDGEWASNPDFSFWKFPLIELDGKTMGIIGFGKIGRAVARLAQAFGMRVLVHGSGRPLEVPKGMEQVTLDTLLSESDVVSLHCPLTPKTENMVDRGFLAKMRKNALLVNTSRGQLIKEEDLRNALNNGVIAGAALDVVSKEPIDPENPLLVAKNCILTPHIAWAPLEARQRLMTVAVSNYKAFLNGQPVNVVS